MFRKGNPQSLFHTSQRYFGSTAILKPLSNQHSDIAKKFMQVDPQSRPLAIHFILDKEFNSTHNFFNDGLYASLVFLKNFRIKYGIIAADEDYIDERLTRDYPPTAKGIFKGDNDTWQTLKQNYQNMNVGTHHFSRTIIIAGSSSAVNHIRNHSIEPFFIAPHGTSAEKSKNVSSVIQTMQDLPHACLVHANRLETDKLIHAKQTIFLPSSPGPVAKM